MTREAKQAPCLVSGKGASETRFPLVDRTVWTVGRSRRNEILIDHEMISRTHAMIQRAGADFLLVDLGSRNGSFVNDTRVAVPVFLKHEDKVRFGGQELLFLNSEPASGKDEASPDATVGSESTRVLISFHEITVLVVDIRDFTGLSQQLDEDRLAQTIGSWMRRGGEILQAERSWAQKYIGDAIMGVWVHRREQPHLDAIYHALVALSKLTEATAWLQEEFDLPGAIRIGAGINTDHASVGNLGSGDSADFTALGDGVNKAFRLETASKQIGYDLVVGETTFAYIQEAVTDVFDQRTVKLKGYQKPSVVYATRYPKIELLLQSLRESLDAQEPPTKTG